MKLNWFDCVEEEEREEKIKEGGREDAPSAVVFFLPTLAQKGERDRPLKAKQ